MKEAAVMGGGAPSGQRAPKVLRASHLAKRFGPISALSDVSLELEAGEIMAVCGENGAGKSTLVKILTGIIRADEGTIEMDGHPVHIHSPRAAQEIGINLVSQELSICPDLSVLDNIWLGAIEVPFFHRHGYFRMRAKETLERLGAGHIDLDRLASTLATGERQLIEIARMLSRNTRILILDEPTATLSDHEIESIMRALRAVKAEGHSVLYITHRLSEVFDICDSAIVLRNGKEVAAAKVADLDRKTLIEHMLGRPLEEMYPNHEEHAGEVVMRITDLRIPGAVNGFDLNIPRGQIVCITGQIGSGAEEVVRAVAGLVADATGSVSVEGKELRFGHPGTSRRLGVRYVSGDRAEEGIFIDLSVAENLVATRLRQRSEAGLIAPLALRREAAALAAKVAVDKRRLGSTASNLSGGNQQKLAFGRCVDNGDPGIIAMIEPTRGIDVGARAEIYQLMRDFCEQGYGLLVASSDFAEVLGIGDVVVTLYRGRIVRTHRSDDVSLPQIVAEVTHPIDHD